MPVVAIVLLAALAHAQPTTTLPPPPTIPVAEVFARAENLIGQLRTIEGRLAPDPEVQAISADLPAWSERVRRGLAETDQILAQGAPLQTLDQLATSWQARRDALAARNAVLARRALQLESDLEVLTAARDLWTRSAKEARARAAPAPVLTRIRDTLRAIEATRRRVEEERARILALQDETAGLQTAMDDLLARIEEARRAQVGRILRRDSPPIWGRGLRSGFGAAIRRVQEDVDAQLQQAAELRERHLLGIALQTLLFGVLVLLFRAARRRAKAWGEEEPELVPAGQVLEHPYASALLLTLITTYWAYPALPHVLVQLIGAAAIIPALRILLPATSEGLRPALSVAGAFFLMDRLRDATAAAPGLEQLLFLIEMAVGIALMQLMPRPTLQAPEGRPSPPRRLTWVPRIFLVVFVVALVAAAVGYVQLARTVAGGALTSTYLAMVLHASVRALNGLMAYLLRARGVRDLGIVRARRDLIQRQLVRVLGWLAVAAWVTGVLRAFQLLRPVVALGRGVLAIDLAPGPVVLPVGHVLAFAVTLLSAYLLARLLRAVLEHEVFPRVPLPRGIPYATSTVLTYLVIGSGAVLALGALGLDLNRFTVLAGALGVGIGFGLQNVINNFVSGLILLFERPIQVGDAVQVGDVTGQVQRIGVRSSTIRTPQGADVIVPNAILIQERVTNWTFADRLRRMDLKVGVAYGTDPERVLALLHEVALAHKKVLKAPAPQAIFSGFGESALEFELWAWTARGEEVVTIRSELAIGISRALAEAGIAIPFPQREVHLRNANDSGPSAKPDGGATR
jgi:small-conductance mechanosensitive channel